MKRRQWLTEPHDEELTELADEKLTELIYRPLGYYADEMTTGPTHTPS